MLRVDGVGRCCRVDAVDAVARNSHATTQAIPIIGFWKLLPTFGGCVVTASKMNINENALNLEVEYTTAKPVEGLSGLGEWIWDVKVPVGAVWKLLPWNRGLPPTCAVEQVYLDDDVRIAKDTSGQYFVYARPV